MAIPEKIFLDIQPALTQLRDQDVPLSPALLSALSALKKNDLTAFAATWIELPVERRRRAAQWWVELAEANAQMDFNALFRYLLNDDDAQVRVSAIDGLWEDEDPALVKPLIGFLRSDPDARVRAAAADSLGRFVLLSEYDRLGSSLANLAHEALFATLRDALEPAPVRAPALESLSYSSRDGVRDLLAAAYDSDEAQMRVSAIAGMGRSADTSWCETVAAELDSPDPRMRFEAVRAVGELECREQINRVLEMLDDSDREVQIAAIGALGRIGGKRAKNALTQIAQADDAVLAPLAEDALAELTFYDDLDLPLIELDADDQADDKIESDQAETDEDDEA
ncbi:MAG: HEAT repeat domain-containing protein [Chloroflexi bacterium]|nr:HEAT repeat domain-containing protein [Chloroflexota bacterium]